MLTAYTENKIMHVNESKKVKKCVEWFRAFTEF